MRILQLTLAFLLPPCVALADGKSELWRQQSERNRFPATFASVDEATDWAQGFFAGGHVDEASLDSGRFLVLFQHGSGVPVIRIGLYRLDKGRWRFVTDAPPPRARAELFRATTAEDAIFLVGEKSGLNWRFYPTE